MGDCAEPRVEEGRAGAHADSRAEAWLVLLSAFVSLTLLALFTFFRDLPMADLPQHAAQLDTWLKWDVASAANPDLELNLRTPYWLAYVLAGALAPAFGVIVALKLVIWLACVTNSIALTLLARRLGHDGWLGLLGFPTAFGFAFYFGFVSFIVAVPIGLFALVAALGHGEKPNAVRGVVLGGLLCLTLFAHGVAAAITCACAIPLLLSDLEKPARRLAPLLAPIVLGLVWVVPGSSMTRMGQNEPGRGLWRLVDFPASLVAFDARDLVGTALGVWLLSTLAVALGPASRRLGRWIPLGVVLAGFCFFPAALNGYGFMAPRFVAFFVPAMLIAFRPRKVSGRLRRALVVLLTFGWLAFFGVRLAKFNRESAPFHVLLARLDPGLRVRSIIFNRESHAFPGVPVFLHFAAYYLIEKGGVLGHSFTMYPNSVLRLKRGVAKLVVPGSEWTPEMFDAEAEATRFDYFILRSYADRGEHLFGSSPVPVLRESHLDAWWVYRVRH